MATWQEFQQAAPELARLVRERFAVRTHATLATLRRDGSPRISGTGPLTGAVAGYRFELDITEAVLTRVEGDELGSARGTRAGASGYATGTDGGARGTGPRRCAAEPERRAQGKDVSPCRGRRVLP